MLETGLCDRISIHALLAESDNGHEQAPYIVLISIHALLAESDIVILRKKDTPLQFLSTLSLRRATKGQSSGAGISKISIHALLAESDDKSNKHAGRKLVFLSTLSLRRATHNTKNNCIDCCISIHALLAESDACITIITICIVPFLSTLSLRRATLPGKISESRYRHFYPRSPCGERRVEQSACPFLQSISIHALLAESDAFLPADRMSHQEFLSTLSLRRATHR